MRSFCDNAKLHSSFFSERTALPHLLVHCKKKGSTMANTPNAMNATPPTLVLIRYRSVGPSPP